MSCWEDLTAVDAALYLTVSRKVWFGRKSFEVFCGPKKEMGAVLLQAMKCLDFLLITISGRSGIREGTGMEGNSRITRLNVG